jgi:hypothetical protein
LLDAKKKKNTVRVSKSSTVHGARSTLLGKLINPSELYECASPMSSVVIGHCAGVRTAEKAVAKIALHENKRTTLGDSARNRKKLTVEHW